MGLARRDWPQVRCVSSVQINGLINNYLAPGIVSKNRFVSWGA